MAHITNFGHSCFLVEESGTRIIVDPWISENKHTPLGLDDVGHVDLVLVSHAAFDHLGDAFEIVKRTNAELICGSDVNIRARKAGIKQHVSGVIYGVKVPFNGGFVKVLDAKHSSFSRLDDGRFITGPPLSFLVRYDSGFSFWHSGDTALFGDMKLYGELYAPQLVIAGVGAAEGFHTELDPEEAAMVAEWMRARWAIPMHYVPGGDEPERFEAAMRARRSGCEPMLMKPGQTIELGA